MGTKRREVSERDKEWRERKRRTVDRYTHKRRKSVKEWKTEEIKQRKKIKEKKGR